ncbi:MAG: hypothetical protein AB7I48_24610 [Planctomycetaceae bacterium]
MSWLRNHCASSRTVQAACLAVFAASLAAGCTDYRIKEGDSPQIIALKKMGAQVSSAMTGGENIDLKDTGVDDDDLVHFEELPNVATLNLSGTDVTDEGLKHLAAGPTKLSELILDETELTDTGIETIHELSQLSVLSLCGTKITDKTLAMLVENHPGIVDLRLMRCDQITNDGLKSIAQLPRLGNLFLADCKQITDEGLEHLMGKPGMRMVHLLNTGCTNAAVERLASTTGTPFVLNAEGKPAGALAKFANQ